MEDHILAYKAPLYGRRTAQLKVNPFDFFESCRCFAGRPGVDKALAYGIVGGTPQYLTGCSRMNEISNKAGEDTSICAAYMKNLTALDIAQFFAKDMDPLDLTPEQKEIQDKIYLVYNPASQK